MQQTTQHPACNEQCDMCQRRALASQGIARHTNHTSLVIA